jgi:4-hydroxy-tetrahydrodipicolinate synthase
MNRFHGIIPAMATPFASNGCIDELLVESLIEWYLDCGVHGLSIAGSQGEFFSLDIAERKQLVELAAKAIAGRVPLYAGTGGVTTAEAISLTQAAEESGADVALVITPYFIQPTQDELVEHFTEVARSTKLPVVLYNNPPRTGVNIQPTTLFRCMERAENIVGIKDSSGDVTQAIECLLLSERRALLFSGRDTVTLTLLTNGGHGTISPAANVFPKLMVKLYDEFLSGNIQEARRISDICAPLRTAWSLGSFPVVIKEAMTCVGHSAGPARLPIKPLAADKLAELKKIIAQIEVENVRAMTQ